MGTKPQDIVFALKLISLGNKAWTYAEIAEQLCLSASEANAAARRAVIAGLCRIEQGQRRPVPIPQELKGFLLHGIRYVFPAVPGAVTRGVPTAFAAPVVDRQLRQSQDQTLVWPWADGDVRGQGLRPLYKTAPQAALLDEKLYKLLAVVDVLRGRSARGREVAHIMLSAALHEYAQARSS